VAQSKKESGAGREWEPGLGSEAPTRLSTQQCLLSKMAEGEAVQNSAALPVRGAPICILRCLAWLRGNAQGIIYPFLLEKHDLSSVPGLLLGTRENNRWNSGLCAFPGRVQTWASKTE
jgi:hypothetical protein